RGEEHRRGEAPDRAGSESADAEPAQPLRRVRRAVRVVAIAEIKEPVQHDHHGEEARPEELDQPPLVQLDRREDADHHGRHEAERQLAVELLDAIGAHERRIGTLTHVRAHRSRRSVHALDAVRQIAHARKTDAPSRAILKAYQKLLPLRITPTAMPSIASASRRRSSSIGSNSGLSASRLTAWPRRRSRFTVTSSPRRATTICP